MFDPEAEAAPLVDHVAIAAAEAVLAEAERRQAEAQARATAAEEALAAARATLPALLEQAIAGEVIPPKRVAAAYAAVADAERFATFCTAVAQRLMEPVEAARAALAEVRHTAWLPVLERGIALRIKAAMQADRTRMLGTWGMDTPPGEIPQRQKACADALERAKGEWEAGHALIRHACANGLRFPKNPGLTEPQWPSSERSEREFWRRPLRPEEVADAA